MKDKITPQCFVDTQRRVLEPRIEEICELIEASPFRDKIKYLLEHQNLATEALKTAQSFSGYSNCGGTCLFLIGEVSQPTQATYEEVQAIDSGSEIFLPYSNIPLVIREEIALFDKQEARKVPGMVALKIRIDSPRDYHAGVYLGSLGDLDLFFTKHGCDGRFGPETGEELGHGRFLLPKFLRARAS